LNLPIYVQQQMVMKSMLIIYVSYRYLNNQGYSTFKYIFKEI